MTFSFKIKQRSKRLTANPECFRNPDAYPSVSVRSPSLPRPKIGAECVIIDILSHQRGRRVHSLAVSRGGSLCKLRSNCGSKLMTFRLVTLVPRGVAFKLTHRPSTLKGFYDAILRHPKLNFLHHFYVSSGAVFCYESNGVDRTLHFMSCKFVMEGDLHY